MPKQLIAVALSFVLIACQNTQDSSPSALSPQDSQSSEAPPDNTSLAAATASPLSMVGASVSKATLTAGQVQSASVTLASSATVQNVLVEIRIYKAGPETMFARKDFSPVNLFAGSQQTLTFDFQSPLDMPGGQYDVRVGAWGSASTLLYAFGPVFTVQASPEARKVSVVSSSVSQNPLRAGQLQTAAVTLTSTTTLQGLIVDIRIYNSSANTLYATKTFSPVNLFGGSQQRLTFDFQSPANMPPGQYDIRVGVWDSAWNTLFYQTRDVFMVSAGQIALNCQDGAWLTSGSYAVENNQWGKGGATGSYSQCVGIGPVAADGSVSARWTWTWPSGPGEIKAYPEIVFGQKPGYPPTPNTNLPRRLDQISQATSSWSTRSTYTGTGQLTFDLWLTSDPLRYPRFLDTPITHEIMIAVEPYGGYGLNRNPGWFVEEIVINGVRYRTYKADNFGPPERRWRFLVFQMLTPMVSGSLDLRPLFDYLKARGFIQGNEYLSSIEFGSELVEGSGDVTVDSFKATVN